MSKIFIRKITDYNQTINLENINPVRAKYLNKLNDKSKYISYLSWLLLKEVVKEEYNLDIDKLTLKSNSYNKPYFDEFYFNISHSFDLIVVAISNKEIGVDIEKIRTDLNLKQLAKKIHTESECAFDVFKRFGQLEAYYKKIGTGLKPSYLNNKINVTSQVLVKDDENNYVLSIDCDDNNIEKIEWR